MQGLKIAEVFEAQPIVCLNDGKAKSYAHYPSTGNSDPNRSAVFIEFPVDAPTKLILNKVQRLPNFLIALSTQLSFSRHTKRTVDVAGEQVCEIVGSQCTSHKVRPSRDVILTT